MSEIGILGVFCGSASLTGMLLAIYFFFSKKTRQGVGWMLGLLFLAISMRIAKSVWHYVLYDYAKLGVGQGLMALAIIGPSLLFYLYYSNNRTPHKLDFLHWLWPILALVISIIEPISFRYLYQYGTYLVCVYLIIAIVIHWRTDYESKSLARFNRMVISGVFLIAASFVYQLTIDGVLLYTYGAAFASLIIYLLLFFVLNNSLVISNNQNKDVTDEMIEKIKYAFEKDRIYLKPGITLNSFAAEFDIPSYLISPSVNKAYQMTFPETINHFRVLEVKKRLENGDHKKLKIEGLANEAGFTTPSAFYAAFKKQTGLTPTQYQKTL